MIFWHRLSIWPLTLVVMDCNRQFGAWHFDCSRMLASGRLCLSW